MRLCLQVERGHRSYVRLILMHQDRLLVCMHRWAHILRHLLRLIPIMDELTHVGTLRLVCVTHDRLLLQVRHGIAGY